MARAPFTALRDGLGRRGGVRAHGVDVRQEACHFGRAVRRGHCTLYKRVVHELQCSGPCRGVLREAVPDEVSKLGGHVAAVQQRVHGGRAHCHRAVHDGAHEVKVVGGRLVWVLAQRALERNETDAPDVGGKAVRVAKYALGAHVVRGADEGGRHLHCVRQLPRDPKIRELHLAARVEEDVGGLEVAVQLVLLLVQVDEALQHLHHHLPEHALRHRRRVSKREHAAVRSRDTRASARHHILQGAPVHELEREVDHALAVEGVVQRDEEIAADVAEHLELVDHLLAQPWILHRRELLECELLA
mmetsp:Transcript_11189/g.29145  ORF Transcript_11189/g.29145 Transcript_11189/m.29145 type:complete len:302 (+) Transcript_11189:134-1039(+)